MAAAAAAAAAGSPTSSVSLQDEVRTIFISGFPPDVRDRELHNLLRYLPGYEACQMNWKTGQPQGFALFSSPAAARFAVDLVSGSQFDEAVMLRAEMARKNMYLKLDDPSVKRSSRPSPLMPPALMPVAATVPMSPQAPGPHGPHGALGALSHAAVGPPGAAAALFASPLGSPTGMLPLHHLGGPLRPQGFSPVTNLRDNPPCNTLFIGNLGDNISDTELRALMSSQPGYRQMKLFKGPRSTTAFVEFSDVTSAMMVHQTLQGAVLHSSDRGGVRIQYSKNPFGRREDAPPGDALGGAGAGGAGQHHAAAVAAAAQAAAAAAGAGAPATVMLTSGGGGGGGSGGGGAPAAAPPAIMLPAAGGMPPPAGVWVPGPQPPAVPPAAAAAAAAPHMDMTHVGSYEYQCPPDAAAAANHSGGGNGATAGAPGGVPDA
ncbi:MAG: hypothetical protein J3K34DRAFT_388206 [Monoraphidium minutum]|nr:MAG: hypothetical protein J3K34DRAFT_388206 [Monoraphidium minutum]